MYDTDNITIKIFNNLFAYTMDGILQDLCDFPYTFINLIWGIRFIFHIISLRKWFDNKVKNKASQIIGFN